MDLDKRPDGPMLEGACVNYARAVEADLILERDGLTVEEKFIDEESGEAVVLKVKKHPAVEISNGAWRLLRAFCSEFGLSPVSRTRLQIGKDAPDSGMEDLAALLNQPRVPRESKAVN
jgi:P27 family predicted phage terminase small subunit